MTITAKIIKDSISKVGKVRLTTLQLRYPRFIHAEFMTHRVFSRNASSSRAVPVKKLIQDIIDDTAMPIHWGANKPGMQADEECNEMVDFIFKGDGVDVYTTMNKKEAWYAARDNAILAAQSFNDAGYHKQIVNRLLEPFSHINVVVTATEWDNFFLLRDHKDAQPEIHELAIQIKKAMAESKPKELDVGEWHLPYINQTDWDDSAIRTYKKEEDLENKELDKQYEQTVIKCSVARCARVSYMTHEMKVPTIDEDLKLYERLVGSVPQHMSPTEHQATPSEYKFKHMWGNFRGWAQYRKYIE